MEIIAVETSGQETAHVKEVAEGSEEELLRMVDRGWMVQEDGNRHGSAGKLPALAQMMIMNLLLVVSSPLSQQVVVEQSSIAKASRLAFSLLASEGLCPANTPCGDAPSSLGSPLHSAV